MKCSGAALSAFAAKHRLARATTLIAVLGIAAGVASLIVALAWQTVFAMRCATKYCAHSAHHSHAQRWPSRRELSAVAAEIAHVAGVSAAAGTTYDGAVIIGPKSSAYGVLRGIDQSSSQMTNEITATIVRGSLDRSLNTTAT